MEDLLVELLQTNPRHIEPPHATTGSGNFSLAKAAPEDSGPGKYRAPGTLSTSATSKVSGPPGSTFVDSQVSKSAAKNAEKQQRQRQRKLQLKHSLTTFLELA